MIKTFLFDLGNVLVRFSHERMCQQLAQVCGIPMPDMQRFLIDSGLQWEFERGRIDEREVHRRLEALAERTLDPEATYRASSDIFWMNDGMLELVDQLKDAGYRLVLLSNTCSSHIRFVGDTFSVLDRFDALVLSYEVGAAKPEAEIFRAALHAIQVEPAHCFYTDDIAEYVAIGRSFGMQGETFTSHADLLSHLRSHSVPV